MSNIINPFMPQENNIKNSKHHSLFIDVIPEEKIPIEIEKGVVLYDVIPEYTRYRMFIDLFDEDKRGLHDIFNTLWDACENSELELRINSRGGRLNEGLQFYNLIKNNFPGRCMTVLDSAGYSMGAMMFCMGDKRAAMSASDLMFHDYSGGSIGKGMEMESQILHESKNLRKFFHDIVVKPGFLSEDEFEQMIIGKDFWFDVEEMCRRGIATHVIHEGYEYEAEAYLKKFHPPEKPKRTRKRKKPSVESAESE